MIGHAPAMTGHGLRQNVSGQLFMIGHAFMTGHASGRKTMIGHGFHDRSCLRIRMKTMWLRGMIGHAPALTGHEKDEKA